LQKINAGMMESYIKMFEKWVLRGESKIFREKDSEHSETHFPSFSNLS